MNISLVLLSLINLVCIHSKSISSKDTSELLNRLTNNYNNDDKNSESNTRINKREIALGLGKF